MKIKIKNRDILTLILILILISSILLPISSVPIFSQEKVLSNKEKQQLISQHYTDAINFFQSGDYSKAVRYWNEILKLDPSQKQPLVLIKMAEEKLKSKNKAILVEIEKFYKKGEYTGAFKKLKQITETDPTNEYLQNLSTKLEKIVQTIKDRTSDNKIDSLIRKGITYYLNNEKTKIVLHSIIYASQISAENKEIKNFIDLLFEEFPSVASTIQTLPGIDIVEQKLVTALNNIYDSKFDKAILECNDVLELEPENILAMKRLGSAYYALGKKEKAREVWNNALKVAPKDAELKSFLKY